MLIPALIRQFISFPVQTGLTRTLSCCSIMSRTPISLRKAWKKKRESSAGNHDVSGQSRLACIFNLLGAYYSELPVRIDIAGTIDSIAKINADTLMKCYNLYHPSNMIILVVGEVEPSSVFHMVESMIEKKEARAEIRRIYPKEPDRLNKSYVEQSLAYPAQYSRWGTGIIRLTVTELNG